MSGYNPGLNSSLDPFVLSGHVRVRSLRRHVRPIGYGPALGGRQLRLYSERAAISPTDSRLSLATCREGLEMMGLEYYSALGYL